VLSDAARATPLSWSPYWTLREVAALRTEDPAVIAAARDYRQVAQLFGVNDPDNDVDGKSRAYHAAQDATLRALTDRL